MKEGFTGQRCPKCGGNVFAYRDLHGWYEQCLQCSRMWYLDSVAEPQDKMSSARCGKAERTKVPSQASN